MHRTRQETSTRIPITRKGTKYIARTRSHLDSSVPLVVAMRDMLKLAQTAREVREMIKAKKLSINGRVAEGFNESIQLFHLLKADKIYMLSLLPSGRFTFVEHKGTKRVVKITNRTLVTDNKIQLHMHDGTNIIGKKEHAVGDSLYLEGGKIVSHVPLAKGSAGLVTKGKYVGQEAKVLAREGQLLTLKINDTTTTITQNQVTVL